MGVLITDQRAVINEADSLTNWTLADDTPTDTFAEGPNCVATAINIATDNIYFTTGTGIDISSTLVYIYSSVVATQDGWESGVHAMYLGDGTDAIAWHMQGSDRRVFAHSDGPVQWSNFVIDGSVAKDFSASTEHTVVAGTLAALTMTSITSFGARFITLSKALGGGNNCYVDIIRYGNDGIRVTSGTTSDPGDFLDVCIEDRDTATLKGHGVIRELSPSVYSIQSPITIGDSGASTDTYFRDSGPILAFEDRIIGNDKYYFKVEGHASATNEFGLTGATISSSGPNIFTEFDSGNIDTLELQNCVFSNLGRTIKFSDAADATGHSVTQSTFNNCGVVTIGAVDDFSNNNVVSSSLYGSQSAATYFNDGSASANTSDVNISSYAGGYGLYIDSTITGTISLTNWTFDQSGTADIYWAGVAGTLTINLVGTTNASSTASAGGTVTLVSTTDFTLTNLQPDTEVRIYLSGTSEDHLSFGEEIYGVESATGSTTYQYGTDIVASGHNAVIMIHAVQYENLRFTVDLLGTETSIPIQQQFDRNYSNP